MITKTENYNYNFKKLEIQIKIAENSHCYLITYVMQCRTESPLQITNICTCMYSV